MQYSITINQKAIVDSGLGIDVIDASIMTTLLIFGNSSSCIKTEHNGSIYHWFDHGKIASELPMLNLKKDSVYRRLKKMCDMGLLSQHPESEKLGKSLYKIEDLTIGLFSDRSDVKKQTLGDSSSKPSDNKPTNHNTIYHNTNDHISSPSQVQEVTESDLIIKFVDKPESTLEEKIIKKFHDLFCKFRTKPGKLFKNKTLSKSKMSAWKLDLDRIMRIDGYSREDLLEVYRFLNKGNDPFWRNTIYSLAAIRQYWDQIQDKMRLEALTKEKKAQSEKEQQIKDDPKVFPGVFKK
jgi:hypothetical protein